jgi:hypothetical protein
MIDESPHLTTVSYNTLCLPKPAETPSHFLLLYFQYLLLTFLKAKELLNEY